MIDNTYVTLMADWIVALILLAMLMSWLGLWR